jgi:hypothetical protein
MDNDAFMQALLTFQEKLHVLTAPSRNAAARHDRAG